MVSGKCSVGRLVIGRFMIGLFNFKPEEPKIYVCQSASRNSDFTDKELFQTSF